MNGATLYQDLTGGNTADGQTGDILTDTADDLVKA